MKMVITFMSFQTCMSLFPMLNIKEDIFKNAGNQTIDGPHWLKYLFPYYGSQWGTNYCLILYNFS